MSPFATWRHLVAENGLDLAAVHALQEAGADGDQRLVAPRAGREGIGRGGLEIADFRHADAGLRGEPANGFDEPRLVLVARFPDHLHAHHALRHPLGNGEGHEGSAEAEHGAENQQRAEVDAIGVRARARRREVAA